ncbi:early nodulin-75-like [Oryza brachyantha]|uniref:early nodulin-75-like n=1 Tax=Oryza brachyantha TaxID=4533 RepID=UPI001ADAE905|nr:early nodulin-75-like [Oryza brachyantha]
MGCYPLGRLVSRALGKCNGRESGWREERMDYAMAYPPGPPTETHYMRPVARAATVSSANSVYVIPPPAEPPHQKAPEPPPPPQQQQQHPAQQQPQQQKPPTPAQEAPPAEPKPPKRGKSKKSGRVRFGPEPPPQSEQQQQQQPPPQQQQQEQTPQAANAGCEYAPGRHAPAPPWYFRYTPSPLPRWEAATPRRHEYFSGEYRYSYPTPVREGIYRMATDANRLTTIFSEENPNACAIM